MSTYAGSTPAHTRPHAMLSWPSASLHQQGASMHVQRASSGDPDQKNGHTALARGMHVPYGADPRGSGVGGWRTLAVSASRDHWPPIARKHPIPVLTAKWEGQRSTPRSACVNQAGSCPRCWERLVRVRRGGPSKPRTHARQLRRRGHAPQHHVQPFRTQAVVGNPTDMHTANASRCNKRQPSPHAL